MDAQSVLYWSHISTYEACPYRFLLRYGWEEIERTPFPGPRRSMHQAVMGKVVQKAVETLYNDELWRDPKKVSDFLLPFVEREWQRQIKKSKNFINYDKAGMSNHEMIEVCKEGVAGYLRTMKRHRLLGPYARAEVRLEGEINKWVTVGGIADVIVRRKDTGITITDGKNTRWKMRYTNPDQLRWYALCFWREYRVMPDRLGFVWYRFPAGMETFDVETGEPIIEEGVEWIPFDKDDLVGLAHRAVEARNKMRKRKFDAVPVPDVCKNCDFESICEARQEQRERNSSRRRSKQLSELKESEGFLDLEL